MENVSTKSCTWIYATINVGIVADKIHKTYVNNKEQNKMFCLLRQTKKTQTREKRLWKKSN